MRVELICIIALLNEYLLIWIAHQKLWCLLVQEYIERGQVHVVGLVNQKNVVRPNFLEVGFPSLISLKKMAAG